MAYLGTTSTTTVTVDVTAPADATVLTIAVDQSAVLVGATFTISGLLTDAVTGSGIANELIQMQQMQADGTFADVDGITATTDDMGTYSMALSESVVGVYVFQTAFAGAE